MSAVVPAGTFQDRLFQKIREDFGSLMTDDELKKLCEEAIEREFFKPVQIRDEYGRVKIDEQPRIQKIVREAVEKQIHARVLEYVTANKDQFAKIIEDTLAQGFLKVAVSAFETKMSGEMWRLQEALKQALQLR